MGWYDGGGRWDDRSERETLEESPLRRRARQRAEKAASGRRMAISSLFLVAAGALLIPMILIFGGYFVRRALNEGLPQPPIEVALVVTSTPQPVLIVRVRAGVDLLPPGRIHAHSTTSLRLTTRRNPFRPL